MHRIRTTSKASKKGIFRASMIDNNQKRDIKDKHFELLEKNFESLLRSLKEALQRSRSILSYLNIASIVILMAILNLYYAWENNLNFEDRPDFSVQKKLVVNYEIRSYQIKFIGKMFNIDKNTFSEWAKNPDSCKYRKNKYLLVTRSLLKRPILFTEINRIIELSKLTDNNATVKEVLDKISKLSDSLVKGNSGNDSILVYNICSNEKFRQNGSFFKEIDTNDFPKYYGRNFSNLIPEYLINKANFLNNMALDHGDSIYDNTNLERQFLDSYVKRMVFKVPLLGMELSVSDLMFQGTFTILILMIWYFQSGINVHSIIREIIRKTRWMLTKDVFFEKDGEMKNQFYYWIRDEAIHSFVLGTKIDNFMFKRIYDNHDLYERTKEYKIEKSHNINSKKKKKTFKSGFLIIRYTKVAWRKLIRATSKHIFDLIIYLNTKNFLSVRFVITIEKIFCIRIYRRNSYSKILSEDEVRLMINDGFLRHANGYRLFGEDNQSKLLIELRKSSNNKVLYSKNEMNLETMQRFNRGLLPFSMGLFLRIVKRLFVNTDFSFLVIILIPIMSLGILLGIEFFTSDIKYEHVKLFYDDLLFKWILGLSFYIIVLVYSISLYGIQKKTERLQEILYLLGDFYLSFNHQKLKSKFDSFEDFALNKISQIRISWWIYIIAIALFVSIGLLLYLLWSAYYVYIH